MGERISLSGLITSHLLRRQQYWLQAQLRTSDTVKPLAADTEIYSYELEPQEVEVNLISKCIRMNKGQSNFRRSSILKFKNESMNYY